MTLVSVHQNTSMHNNSDKEPNVHVGLTTIELSGRRCNPFRQSVAVGSEVHQKERPQKRGSETRCPRVVDHRVGIVVEIVTGSMVALTLKIHELRTVLPLSLKNIGVGCTIM